MREQATAAVPAAKLCATTPVPTDVVPAQVPASSGTFVNPLEADLVKDHFIERDGIRFAGTHLIIDLWGEMPLDDLELMETTFRDAIGASGATLLHIHLHHFTPNGGISGVAVLAESHISVHTWPERGYAAFDVFMCGDARPEKAVDVIRDAFKPARLSVSEHLRGRAE
jgi:S-adenosylmethionine decarboxylase